MACYFPLTAYKDKSKDASKMSLVFSRPASWRGESLKLPCGQCVGCRLEKSRQWAVRCMHEASLYDENSFLTLTYDDSHLPKDGSLCLEHFQLFMKRLRKSLSPKRVRFYHCGEYGEKFARPHYHALLFNHSFSDRKFFKRSGDGSSLWTSGSLSELWQMGFAVVGALTFESAAYVARYVMKKVTGKAAEDYYGSFRPEYSTMSRRPGIGKGWYDRFSGDVYPRDGVVVHGVVTRPPRFYDNLLGRDDPAALALLKIDRELKSREGLVYNGLCLYDSERSDVRMAVKNVVKLAQVSQLTRHKDGV